MGVGVGVSHHSNSGKNRTSNGSSNPGSTNNGSVVPQTDPNDPSTFVKDPRLKQVFYGLAYTPSGAIPPNCTSTLSTSSPLTIFFSFSSLTVTCATQVMLFKIFKYASTYSSSRGWVLTFRQLMSQLTTVRYYLSHLYLDHCPTETS